VDLALDAVPKSIDLNQIRSYLEGLSGIQEVHDLHVWGLSTTETALTSSPECGMNFMNDLGLIIQHCRSNQRAAKRSVTTDAATSSGGSSECTQVLCKMLPRMLAGHSSW